MAITLDGTNGITTPDLESSGPVIGTTGTFSGNVSGVAGTFSGNVSGVAGTFSGAVQASGVTTNLYPLVSETAKAFNWNGVSTNTFIDFTGIPSWVKRITVIFRQVSLSSTGSLLVQAGEGGTPTTTGYTSISTYVVGGVQSGQLTSTSGFIIQAGAATYQMFGHLIFTNVSGNTWVVSGVQGNITATAFSVTSSGVVALSGVLNMIRVTSTSGTDTFDAGTINIMYE